MLILLMVLQQNSKQSSHTLQSLGRPLDVFNTNGMQKENIHFTIRPLQAHYSAKVYAN